jgi:hypothetical protein
MDELTDTEATVLNFMADYEAHSRKAPTLEEIRAACPMLNWRSSARYTLSRLLLKGYLQLSAPTNYSRRYRVIR